MEHYNAKKWWLNLTNIMLIKRSQTSKDMYCMLPFI